jgi:hypothetical protein
LIASHSAVGISKKGFEFVVRMFFPNRFVTGKGVRPATSKEKVLVAIRGLLL